MNVVYWLLWQLKKGSWKSSKTGWIFNEGMKTSSIFPYVAPPLNTELKIHEMFWLQKILIKLFRIQMEFSEMQKIFWILLNSTAFFENIWLQGWVLIFKIYFKTSNLNIHRSGEMRKQWLTFISPQNHKHQILFDILLSNTKKIVS